MLLQMVILRSLLPALLTVTQAAKWNACIANHLGCLTSEERGVRWQKLSFEKQTHEGKYILPISKRASHTANQS